MSWKLFPKVELHLHLEGAADPAFVRGLAAEKSIDICGIFDDNGAYKYNGFTEFLAVYEAATLALKSPEDFKRLTQSVLENLAEHNVVYAETFVSPDFCGGVFGRDARGTCRWGDPEGYSYLHSPLWPR